MNLSSVPGLRWLPAATFGSWALVLLYLVLSGRYTLSLRPEFGLLLALAHFVAMGCTIALVLTAATARFTLASLLRLLILLLPLAYILTLQQNAQLAGQAFKKRFLGLDSLSWTEPGTPRSASSSPGGTAAAPGAEPTLLQLLFNADLWGGQRVAVQGILSRDEDIVRQYGGNVAVLYRFLITCCAADARPLAVAVLLPEGSDPVPEGWVRVEGNFSVGELQGNRVPLLQDVVISPSDAPAFPYLF
ncbi:MAG: hypothetical protein BWK76_18835 [Desulfobulbaceae bacterium A2]|nr:MAG: hypothetical protein BWK76_18835 [Desulfobulbaceae bacterium A2]